MNIELAEMGLVVPHLGILSLLDEVGTMTQRDLGDYIDVDKATMVKLIDGLERKKYILRTVSKEDRREKKVSLTKSGRVAMKSLVILRRKVEDTFLGKLSMNDRNTLLRLIPKMIEGS